MDNFLDLRLAAELGRCLLERNHELQNYIHVLQKQIEDKQSDMKVRQKKKKLKSTFDKFSYYIRSFSQRENNLMRNVNKLKY